MLPMKDLPPTGDKYRYIPDDIMLYSTYCYLGIQSAVFLGSDLLQKIILHQNGCRVYRIWAYHDVGEPHVCHQLASNPSKIAAFPLTGWKLWYYSIRWHVPPRICRRVLPLTFPHRNVYLHCRYFRSSLPDALDMRLFTDEGKGNLTALFMEFKDKQAIYLQIADYICEQILLGKWPPGRTHSLCQRPCFHDGG
jgi:hypothetical protein